MVRENSFRKKRKVSILVFILHLNAMAQMVDLNPKDFQAPRKVTGFLFLWAAKALQRFPGKHSVPNTSLPVML